MLFSGAENIEKCDVRKLYRAQNTEKKGLMESLTTKTQREHKTQKPFLFKNNNTLSVHRMCSESTFIQVHMV